MPAPRPLLLADVPWLLYRSYFALPKSIAGGEGRPVNALLGTINALLGYVESCPPAKRPRRVVGCLGAEQADYRVKLYPPYHAHREPMPPELAWQWGQAPGLLASLGWAIASSEELEADDVMYSLARCEEQAGGRALLLSGDRDMFAAVSERVAVLELRKGGHSAEVGPAQVRERYGVQPEQVPDFIALRGDPSDNLPGVPGIGAKTAAALLGEHGSAEQLLEVARVTIAGGPAAAARIAPDATPLRPRTAAALADNAQLLATFKRVATLQRIELPRPPARETDFAGGARAARELGMRRLAERLERLAGKPASDGAAGGGP